MSQQGSEAGRLYYLLGIDDSALRSALQANVALLGQAGAAGKNAFGQINTGVAQAAQGAQAAQQATQGLSAAQRSAAGNTAAAAAAQDTLAQSHRAASKAATTQATGLADLKRQMAGLALGAGAISLGKEAFTEYRAFEKGVRQVYTMIPGASKQARAAMEADITRVQETYGVAGTESAKSFYEALSSGVSVDGAGAFVNVASKAAVAGLTDNLTAIDALTTATNAYAATNLTASEAADSLFVGVAAGKMSFEELSQNLSDVLPLAAPLGISIDQVSASLATMTLQGIPVAQATTYMRSAMSELSLEGTKSATMFTQATGKSFKQFIADGGTVGGAMEVLRKKTAEMGQEVTAAFGSQEAGSAALTLSGSNLTVFNDILDQTINKAGAVDRTFAEIAESADFKWNKSMQELKVALRDVGLEITPLILEAAKLAVATAKWGQENKETIVSVAKIAAATLVFAKGIQAVNQAATSIAALNAWRATLVATTVATNGATAATGRLASARAMLNAAGPGAVVAAGAAVVGMGVAGAQGAGDASLSAYYKDLSDGPGSGINGAIAAGSANVAHYASGGLLDGATGYKAAKEAAEGDAALVDAKLAASIARSTAAKQAQAAANVKVLKSTQDMTVADAAFVSTIESGTASVEERKAVEEDRKKIQDDIAKTRASLSSGVDLFGLAPTRFKKVDPVAVASAKAALDAANAELAKAQAAMPSGGAGKSASLMAAERAVEQARSNPKVDPADLAIKEQRLAEVRAAQTGKVKDLAEAEDRLEAARKKAGDAADRLKKAKTREDQSLSPEELRKRTQAMAASQETLAGDVRKLAQSGVVKEGLEKLLNVEKSNPGTIHRMVQAGINSPVVTAINRGLGRVDGANQVLAEALNGQIQEAGDKARATAYEQGKTIGEAMARGEADGYKAAAKVNPYAGDKRSGQVADEGGRTSAGGRAMGSGRGITIGTVNVNAEDPAHMTKKLAEHTAKGNMAGGQW